jgi:hypothetical protein
MAYYGRRPSLFARELLPGGVVCQESQTLAETLLRVDLDAVIRRISNLALDAPDVPVLRVGPQGLGHGSSESWVGDGNPGCSGGRRVDILGQQVAERQGRKGWRVQIVGLATTKPWPNVLMYVPRETRSAVPPI